MIQNQQSHVSFRASRKSYPCDATDIPSDECDENCRRTFQRADWAEKEDAGDNYSDTEGDRKRKKASEDQEISGGQEREEEPFAPQFTKANDAANLAPSLQCFLKKQVPLLAYWGFDAPKHDSDRNCSN